MEGWTYIVQCCDDSYYVGSTINLENRVHQHNEGVGARYTACRRPVTLVWAAEFANVREAFWFEKQVQNWSRDKREALIDGRYADLPELARAYMHRATTTGGRAVSGVLAERTSVESDQGETPDH